MQINSTDLHSPIRYTDAKSCLHECNIIQATASLPRSVSLSLSGNSALFLKVPHQNILFP